jgi:hypothetical protein
MPDYLVESPEAAVWIDEMKAVYLGNAEYGDIASSVIWSDITGEDGKQIVPLDPHAFVENITANGLPMLKGHDPGRPAGNVLAADVFTTPAGSTFIAALLGFYQGKAPFGFRDLGVESAPVAASPSELPAIPESFWIEFCFDPKEVSPKWIEETVKMAPMPVRRQELSHNALDAPNELIRVGVIFMSLVWNPFTTSIATEAGKDAYAALKNWIRQLIGKISEQKNPILEIQSHHDECYISFIIRGTNVKRNYAAHDALPLAAAQAVALVANLKAAGAAPKKLVYEFHKEDDIWFPSFAELHDGRFISDNNALIAIEKLPRGLSLGIGVGETKSQLPSIKRPG